MQPLDYFDGNALEEEVEKILSRSNDLLPLKITEESGEAVKVIIFRCTQFESLLQFLGDHARVGLLNTQHNILKIFEKVVRFRTRATLTEVKLPSGKVIDLCVGDQSYEIKSMQKVRAQHISPLISHYFDEMVENATVKPFWDLCFFGERADSKINKNLCCLYYLVVIEVATSKLTSPGQKKGEPKKKLITDAQNTVDRAIAKVTNEDGLLKEGGLMPVNNFLIVDKLRNEKRRLKGVLEEKDHVIEEKDHVIEEKDHVIEEKDHVIEEKDHVIEEKDRLLEEKDRFIAELKKKLQ